MGEKYTDNTISGYNASPPADDATQVEANKLTWAKHKTKLADPVRVLSQAINSSLLAHLDESVVNKAAIFTTTTAEHKRTINITADATMTLGDASAMGAGYIITIKNSHSAANTVDLDTGSDTLDGTAAGSVSLSPNQLALFIVNQAVDGYYMFVGMSVDPADGLIIAGQGSTSDVTIKNDADVTVASVATGTTIMDFVSPPTTDGIAFPASQNASADKNTLDDYEEDVWTPSLGGNTSYATQDGSYIKIGRVVFIDLNLTITTLGTGSTTVISGLPFLNSSKDKALSIRASGLAVSPVSVTASVTSSTSTISIRHRTTGSANDLGGAILGDSAVISIAGHYTV